MFNHLIGQVQIGADLTGLGNFGAFGRAVSLDSTGHRVAIGAPQKNYGQYKGQVRVFDLVDSAWVQIGQNLDGAANFEFFGQAVALSADGNILIVRIAQLNSIGAGYVQVYHLVGDTVWTQLGTDLTSSLGSFGRQIDINSDGSRIVIGSGANYAKVFEWNNTLADWEQLGGTLLGSTACNPPEYFGDQVAIDGSGNRVIIGAYNHDLGCSPTSDAGRAAVFEWDGTTWNQLGQSLFGAFEYGFGGSVDISGNGNRIACGAANRFGRGRVFTYEYNAGNGTWEQYGDTIQGVVGDKLGRDVNLSYDGCIIACGAEENSNIEPGRVKRYRLVSSQWTSDGIDLIGAGSFNTLAGDNGTVAINADGSLVALGSPNSGICRIYQYPNNIDTTIIDSSCGSYWLNGIEYSASGSYTQSISSVNSCDSTIQLELTISSLDSSIVQIGDTLTAVQDSVSYQWYNCETGLDILDETGQNFIPKEPGIYAVRLSNGICNISSECQNLQTSIHDFSPSKLQIYPNPVNSNILWERDLRRTDHYIFRW
ncbi:MAG: hypothetical protein R3B93_09170 [Bacteroidia bacterium]